MPACDACRKRKIKCWGGSPCQKCVVVDIPCTYEAVPQRRGPRAKRDSIIEELRQKKRSIGSERGDHGDDDDDDENAEIRLTKKMMRSATAVSAAPKTLSELTSSSSSNFLSSSLPFPSWKRFSRDLLEELIFDYFHNLHLITPVLNYHDVIAHLDKDPPSYIVYGLIMGVCCVSCRSSQRDNIRYPADRCRIMAEDFLSEAREAHDKGRFGENINVESIMADFFLFTASFRSGKFSLAWFFIREAITMAQILGIDREENYSSLNPAQALQHWILFFVLFVTERGVALHRHFPLTLRNTIQYPEFGPKLQRIYGGLLQMARLFTVVDELRLLMAENNTAETAVSTALSASVGFDIPVSSSMKTAATTSAPSLLTLQQLLGKIQETRVHTGSFPFDIQKADFLISSLWFRMLILRASGKSRSQLLKSDIAQSIVEDVEVIGCHISKKTIELLGTGMAMKLSDILMSLSEMYGIDASLQPGSNDDNSIGDNCSGSDIDSGSLENRISDLLDRITRLQEDKSVFLDHDFRSILSPAISLGNFLFSKEVYYFGNENTSNNSHNNPGGQILNIEGKYEEIKDGITGEDRELNFTDLTMSYSLDVDLPSWLSPLG